MLVLVGLLALFIDMEEAVGIAEGEALVFLHLGGRQHENAIELVERTARRQVKGRDGRRVLRHDGEGEQVSGDQHHPTPAPQGRFHRSVFSRAAARAAS